MKIILVGYMGSGKSIVAKELSKIAQIPFVELDDLIEKSHNKSIKKIFEQQGELFFRKLEHQIFAELIESNDDLIISTGGGTPCYYNNHELLLNTNCVSIYLSASIKTLFNRLQHQKQNRPLLAHLNDIEAQEFIAKHLFERSFFYHQAKFKVVVDHKSVSEIVNEIRMLLA